MIHPRIAMLTGAVLLYAAAAQAHCLHVTSDKPIRLMLAVDHSKSILPAQMATWKQTAQNVTNCLMPGDAVTVVALHSNSGQSAAAFEREFPVEPTNATIPVRIAVHNEIVTSKKQLRGVVDSIFSAPNDARWTDVFGVFERIPPDSKRQTLLVLLTDAVHSTPEFDMERTRLVEGKFQETFQRLARVYAWPPAPLKGIRVYFVLPSLSGQNRHFAVNDRATLSRWYQSLVNELGGELASFSVDAPTGN